MGPDEFVQNFALFHSPQRVTQEEQFLKNIQRRASVRALRNTLPLFSFSVTFLLFTNRLALNLYCKDFLRLSPAHLQLLSALLEVPWALKVLTGVLSDSCPVFGARAGYCVLGAFLYFCSWTVVFFLRHITSQRLLLIGTTAFFGLMQSFALTCVDVATDSLIVVLSQTEVSAAGLQHRSFFMRSAGVLVGQLATALLLGSEQGERIFRPSDMFLFSALLSLPVFAQAVILTSSTKDRVQTPSRTGVFGRLTTVFRFLKRPRVRSLAVFIFLFCLSPSAGYAFLYFITADPRDGGLGFSPRFLGVLALCGGLGETLGAVLFAKYLSRFPFKKLYRILLSLFLFVYSSQLVLVYRVNQKLGLSDKLFAFSEDVLGDALARLMQMPLLVIIAKECPPGNEGTVYAALISVGNVAGICSRVLSSFLMEFFNIKKDPLTHKTNFDRLGEFVILVVFIKSLGLYFVEFLPDH